jgi:NADPH:quinone reductase-like Zn-dependent oxidoreductase
MRSDDECFGKMKAYEYSKLGLENLTLVERDVPKPGPHQVVVQFHAASLNYRDLLFARGLYNPRPQLPAVPLSDGAGEIIALGEGVTRWKPGDRVCPLFMQGWIEGPLTSAKSRTALGAGDLDGVLREYGAFHEEGLVRIPEHLSYVEAATLPCAAVTAWNALVHVGKIKAGDTILTLGTGGVSVFALQFAKMHGARVIATSGSDDKLARVRALGADETINYKTTREWDREVLRLTNGVGVDQVVEVGGAGTLPRSINATRVEGLISLIGVLARGEGVDPMKILMKSLRVKGILVGSRELFEQMNRAITESKFKPVIDKTFAFDQVPEALKYLESGSHFGKIVVQIKG